MFFEEGSLGEAIAAGRDDAILVFSGQDVQWAEGVRRLLVGRPELRAWCEDVLNHLGSRLAADPTLVPSLAEHGVDVADWLDHPDTTWTAGERCSRHLSLVGTAFAHLVGAKVLASQGLGADSAGVSAITGHSAGLVAAWVVARHGSDLQVSAASDALASFAIFAEVAAGQPDSVHPDVIDRFLTGDEVDTPLLAVAGPTEERLLELIDRFGEDGIVIALQNCWDRWVLGGPPAALGRFAEALRDADDVDASSEPVPSSAGYHRAAMNPWADRMLAELRRADLGFSGELCTPLVDPADGRRFTGGDLTEQFVRSMATRAVRWADTIASLARPGTTVIDVGPSTLTAAITRRALRGSGATVVAAGSPEGMRSLARRSARPSPLADWSGFQPSVASGGPHSVQTLHTRRSGRSAMVLAGMTPTTVDAEIVAAAANAGHVSELAGGGQVSPAIFAERISELGERLAPGHEVVFNALYLDPYLWGMQLGRDRLVQRAREEGAPICGVTVSAGVPEPDEAVDLLDELNGLGIWLNAFKPGTAAQVRRVLEIADRTEHDVWLHLEGGRAGGHHSWVDLEEVLFSTYADIRRHSNVVLMVGGGVGTPERAAHLLDGSWALRHGAYRMPVDGILLGTVAMAAAESTASPSVKAALVTAPGTTELVRAGASGGGVTSGRSGLGADIHYLDNHAARVAALLGELAGDADEIDDRRDEIIGALAATAKPWFGDVTTMTWTDVLERYVELCARGTHGRYEDGCWLDVTHRERFLDLLHRAEARCVELDEGTFGSVFSGPDDLDDPSKALEEMADRYPLASLAELTPSDVAFFVETCDRPGKPVPFVAVIDDQVRRRYLADSLWQAHSDLWEADEVLVIPGPTAVAGIDRADEPVADLLDRFDREVASLLDAPTGADESSDEHRAAPTSVDALLDLAVVRRDGAMVRSPLAMIASGGGTWERHVPENGTATAVLRAGDEVARLHGPATDTGRVSLDIEWPALRAVLSPSGESSDGRLHLEFDVARDHGVLWAEMVPPVLIESQDSLLQMMSDAAAAVAGSVRSGEARSSTSSGGVPDASLARIWAPVFDALRESGHSSGLLRLVHARHHLELEAGADDPGVAGSARLVDAAHVPGGLLLRTRAQAGSLTVTDEFLVRGGSRASDEGSTADGPGEIAGVDGEGAAGEGDSDAGTDSMGDADAPASGVDGSATAWIDTPRSFLARQYVRAPRHPEAFAATSGDANPIHRSDLLARMAGLPGRIVHGMWTSAAAQQLLVDSVLDGDVSRLTGWTVQFLAPVVPGAQLVLTANRVGMSAGRRRIEVSVECAGDTVALAYGEVTPPHTAYVFPGQGIQVKGMGLDSIDRSPGAKSVWDLADRHCRTKLGFSILHVVRDNPDEIEVRGERHRHPAGVLHLTQFTQVAMATVAAAQMEELRESGVLMADAVIAGHSVGEYNALASIGSVLPLEAVLSVVWARGSAMHELVPRDADGASDYRMGVVRPHLAGMSAQDAAELVDAVAAHTGELCQIVNHNLRGRQYAVAGTVGALSELESRLGEGTSPGRAPFLLVPGIDVPFHSRALTDGVAEFRAHLDAALPEEIDPAELVGRYVPNLHPEPFTLERSYVEAVAAVCDGMACGEILARWDELAARPARLTRELLVELLAWQFASPVRWIETTEVMLRSVDRGGLGVQRVVEVGIGTSPTLTSLTRAAVAADGLAGVEVLHVELDRSSVFEESEDPEPAVQERPSDADRVTDPDDDDSDWDGDAPGPASPVPAQSSPAQSSPAPAEAVVDAAPAPAPVATRSPAGDTPDRPVELADAVAALLAHEVQVTPDQLGEDTVDQLVDGASSRRNQVLMDMGKEFGIGSVDGAHEVSRSELVEKLAPMVRGHRHPGPVLSAAVSAGLASCLGPLGASVSTVAQQVTGTWGLGDGWVHRCQLELFLGTRDGASRRGGPLRTLAETADATELIDAALVAAAARIGVTVERPVLDQPGATADAAELGALADRVGLAFVEGARAAATALGDESGGPVAIVGPSETDLADAERLRLLEREHGAERAEAVTPVFSTESIRCLDSVTAWGRADLDHLFHGAMAKRLDCIARDAFVQRLRRHAGSDDRFDDTVRWYAGRAVAENRGDVAADFASIADGATPEQRRLSSRLSGRTVLLSGASPDSIGESVAASLLGAGATVVMVTSSTGRRRRLAVREMFRAHAGPGARLFLVRANLASFSDIDDLLEWLGHPGSDSPHPGRPDVVLPFAASQVSGDVPDTGPRSEVEMRVLLLGVERLVGRLAEMAGEEGLGEVLTAVLPMSPNHGTFGGDGSYGDAKAGLEVLEARQRSEFRRWGRHCRILGAEIGWVRGTGLMGGNDELAPIVEQRLGVRTFAASEMGAMIAELCAPVDSGLPGAPVGGSAEGQLRVDLTGGLGSMADPSALSRLLREGFPDRPAGAVVRSDGSDGSDRPDERELEALITPVVTAPADRSASWPGAPEVPASEMIVVCGVGEVGPWGLASTRHAIERTGELGPAAVVELALACGIVKWEPRGSGGEYVDAETEEPVDEAGLPAQYRDEVAARCGIREMSDPTFEQDVEVFLDRPITIGVADAAQAEAFAAADPGSVAHRDGDGWAVTLRSGAAVRLRRTVELPRGVAAAIPDGLTPSVLGLPVEASSSMDSLAAWMVGVTVQAFRDAGCDPDELLTEVHPARVANTQGTGMGGMDSLRGMYVDPTRATPHANDLLQEALGNTPAAHAMQAFIGGYGSMIHPVGACATAAVSLETAVDLISLDKADAVVAGGMDELGPEGILGFADMAATASSQEMLDAGFEPSEMSRPGDRDRAGFVESQGGGAMVVCRGDVALRLGLPVRAVVGLARSHSDGVQTSIPAPGLGSLAVAMGGMDSPLARALSLHGLSADDIAVVSKHDTSTRANDPNEAAIHERLQGLLGRSSGNPLRVISQKSITGHAKGGAAAWQIAGVCDLFDSALVPGNPNLDSVDPIVQEGPWLVPDNRPLQLATAPRAALVTSLGFGHVSAAVLLIHPDAFLASLDSSERSGYIQRATGRRRRAAHERAWASHGGPGGFRRPENRRLAGADAAQRRGEEMELLADPTARLGPAGTFVTSTPGSDS